VGLLLIAVIIASIASGETPISWLKKTLGPKGPAPFSADTYFEIREPRERRGERIDISHKKSVRIGQGTEILSDASGTFIIRSVKEGGIDMVALTVEKGEVFLKKAGKREKEAIFEERLFDGDVLLLEPYEIRFCTLSGLTRD
jgi:hypothetical protein